jgi:hypothetical protein
MLDGGASLLTGIGGVADARRVTCLHAHAAHALARPGYELGEHVLDEAGELWDHDGLCGTRLIAAGAAPPAAAAPDVAPAAATRRRPARGAAS